MVDRDSDSHHPADLALRRAPLSGAYPIGRRLHAAIELANDCGKDGKPSVVLLQKAKNKFDTIWTYGESAFPPSKSDVPALSEAS